MKLVSAFIQARNYTRGPRRNRIDLIVIHDMEAPEKGTTAEAVARYFQSNVQASAHYCIDSNSIVQCVRDSDIAWHAPGANHNGIGLEHAGYARQTRHEWFDAYSTKMLLLSAKLTARLCKKYGIPVRFVSPPGLMNEERGITTHRAVSAAFRRSSHTDPGTAFPMEWYLIQVRRELRALSLKSRVMAFVKRGSSENGT
jgi:N-acetyl-anhydromuramyl-L-alanine amidase AmpD